MQQEQETQLSDREREMIEAVALARGMTFEQALTLLCQQGMQRRYGSDRLVDAQVLELRRRT